MRGPWTAVRTRVVIPGVGSMKCDPDDARRIAAEAGGRVEVSRIVLSENGAEYLEPWREEL